MMYYIDRWPAPASAIIAKGVLKPMIDATGAGAQGGGAEACGALEGGSHQAGPLCPGQHLRLCFSSYFLLLLCDMFIWGVKHATLFAMARCFAAIPYHAWSAAGCGQSLRTAWKSQQIPALGCMYTILQLMDEALSARVWRRRRGRRSTGSRGRRCRRRAGR